MKQIINHISIYENLAIKRKSKISLGCEILNYWLQLNFWGLVLLLWVNAKAVHVSVHHDTVVTVNKLTGSGRFPQRFPHVFVTVLVVFTHDLLDSDSGFSTIVEWNSRDVVMQDVGFDDVVENVLTDKTEFTVHGGSSPSGESPLVSSVVRHLWVGVLQVGDEHQPVVNKQVRQEVVDKDVEATEVLVPGVENSHLDQDTNVGDDDIPVVSSFKEDRRRVKVVSVELGDTFQRLTGHVRDQVTEPAYGLLDKQRNQCVNRRVSDQVLQVFDTSGRKESFLVLRNEHHVSCQVSGSLVVLGVGVLP